MSFRVSVGGPGGLIVIIFIQASEPVPLLYQSQG